MLTLCTLALLHHTWPVLPSSSCSMLPPSLLGADCISFFPLGGPGPTLPPSLELTPFFSSPRKHPTLMSGTLSSMVGSSFCVVRLSPAPNHPSSKNTRLGPSSTSRYSCPPVAVLEDFTTSPNFGDTGVWTWDCNTCNLVLLPLSYHITGTELPCHLQWVTTSRPLSNYVTYHWTTTYCISQIVGWVSWSSDKIYSQQTWISHRIQNNFFLTNSVMSQCSLDIYVPLSLIASTSTKTLSFLSLLYYYVSQ